MNSYTNKIIIPVKGETKPSKKLIENFPKFAKCKTIKIDRLIVREIRKILIISYGVNVFKRREYYSIFWFPKVKWR